MNLSKVAKITRVSNAVAAGTADVEATVVDTKGYGATLFLVEFGAIVAAAVTSIKVQGSHDNVTFVDLKGTGVTVADTDDNKVVGVDVIGSNYRYLKCYVDRGTQNATIDSILALQYQADKEPVTQPATTNLETHAAPIAGAA